MTKLEKYARLAGRAFKAAPVSATALLALSVISGLWMAMEVMIPARFVDTALYVFRGEAEVYAIYPAIGLTMLTVSYPYVASRVTSVLNARVKIALRNTERAALVSKTARLDYVKIEDKDAWDLIARVLKNPEDRIESGYSQMLELLTVLLRVVCLIVILLSGVWWAALVMIVFAVPIFRSAIKSGKANYEADRETMELERKYNYLGETLLSREASEERALFGYSSGMCGDYAESFMTAFKKRQQVMKKWFIKLKLGSGLFSVFSLAASFLLLPPTLSGVISPGMFMALVNGTYSMVQGMSWGLTDVVDSLAKDGEYMNDVMAFEALPETVGATAAPANPGLAFESLEIKNLTFKYPGCDKPVLDALSLRLERGGHYAFVGVNGAGKTTITKLICGLYTDYEGEILLNGRDIREYSQSELKSAFSVVYQDFARYQTSLRDNLAFGFPEREELISEAARDAELTDIASALPRGYDTELGKLFEGGSDLSTGQWQRVAIARALASPAGFRIMDEPTAALDPIMESNVYAMFKRVSEGVTTLFISHRLGSTKLADTIFVLDGGRVAESGSHEALMALGGEYQKMFDSQRSWYK